MHKGQTIERSRNVFAIVLAGGQGERLQPVSERLVGSPVPKQYLPLTSTQSLLQETAARVIEQVAPVRSFVVAAEAWAPLAQRQLQNLPDSCVVSQPRDLGTAAGLLLPLCHVLAADPEGDVVVTPADHHYAQPKVFGEAVQAARAAVAAAPDQICVLAAKPDDAATDLGWIVRGARVAGPAHKVDSFIEKPDLPLAQALLENGGAWNTMVLVARASTLWRTIFHHCPALASLMEPLIGQVQRHACAEAVARVYDRIGSTADLSRDVLSQAHNLMTCSVGEAGWFDCGTPERLFDWLRRSPHSASPFRRLIEEDRAA